MKKILHISKYYFPFKGGTEQIARDCVLALKGQYEQTVVCFNHRSGNTTDVVDNTEVIRVGCFAKIASQSLSVSYGKVLKKIMYYFKPHIIVFHYPNPFAAYWLLKYVPVETTLVIYWHLDIVKQRFLRKLFINQNRKLINRANKIFVTSPNYMEGSRWLMAAKDKCVVISNCINELRCSGSSEIQSTAAAIRKENKGKIICLAVGRHTQYKGFTYLIQASRYLDDRFRIFIAGEGEMTKKLKKEARQDSKIIFLGLISDRELKAYMSAMDIFCFPSITKNEAFGLALAEAMYYEKPSVVFTISGSGVNYVCLDGITGIEVPNKDIKAYADAMRKLADNPELRNQYGTAARKRVLDNFTDSLFVKNIRREFRKIEDFIDR